MNITMIQPEEQVRSAEAMMAKVQAMPVHRFHAMTTSREFGPELQMILQRAFYRNWGSPFMEEWFVFDRSHHRVIDPLKMAIEIEAPINYKQSDPQIFACSPLRIRNSQKNRYLLREMWMIQRGGGCMPLSLSMLIRNDCHLKDQQGQMLAEAREQLGWHCHTKGANTLVIVTALLFKEKNKPTLIHLQPIKAPLAGDILPWAE